MNDVNLRETATARIKTADNILEAAQRILAKRGYEGLSMRAIAAEVGISQAAIYRHYADKATLIGALIGRGYANILSDAERVDASDGPEDELLARGMRTYIERSLMQPDLFRAVLMQPLADGKGRTDVLGKGVGSGRRTMALLSGLIARGMNNGIFRDADPELSAQAIWAAMYGLVARIILEGLKPGKRRKALAERQIDIIVRGLRK